MGGKRKVIAIAAPDGVLASAIAGPYDLLSSVGTLWQEINQEASDGPAFDVRVVATKPGMAACYGGLAIETDTTYSDPLQADVVLVPTFFEPLLISETLTLSAPWQETADWLRRQAAGGAIICGYSSGVILMAAAGLLDGQKATTHWTLVERATRWFPDVDFQPSETLLPVGEDAHLVTAGGGTCWQDLSLYLIARFASPIAAAHTARSFTILRKTSSQAPFAQFRPDRNHGDGAVSKAQEALAGIYASDRAVSGARDASGLAERTFKRRFKSATGHAPGDYLRRLRIQEARYRLETTRSSIEEISATVGYGDVAFFRTVFKRIVGMTPGLYREQFGLLDHPGMD